ncbi:hypothetical protein [Saccharopolyspora erythraea]|uniref:hypothetical protein n=1 Tax=Saccharopolyspora erythraea TaxID=1836 RepID=UPI0001D31043
MTEIGLVGAFLGGLLSLLSPCSALLLPSFFAYAFNGIAGWSPAPRSSTPVFA